MPENSKAQVAPETQVGAELNRLSDVVEKTENVFEALRQNVSPILRDEPSAPMGAESDEVELTVPRAREIQGIRIRLEKLIKHITDVSGLSEA